MVPVRATCPVELVMVTAPVAGDGEEKPHVAGLPVALDSVAVLLLMVTLAPNSCSACKDSEDCCIEISVCRLVFMLICCSTPANETSCSVNWVVSIGDSGSWFCN